MVESLNRIEHREFELVKEFGSRPFEIAQLEIGVEMEPGFGAADHCSRRQGQQSRRFVFDEAAS